MSVALLENDNLRVALDPVTGGIVSIRDKRIGHDYLASPVHTAGFRAVVPRDGLLSDYIEPSGGMLRVESNGAVFTYEGNGLRALVRYALAESHLALSLELSNTGRHNVEEVFFPMVAGFADFPGARIVAPTLSRRFFNDPFGKDLGGDHRIAYDWQQRRVFRYPHKQTTAWLDFGSDMHGISLESRGMDFSICDFYVHKHIEKKQTPIGRSLEMGACHPRRIKPGETWFAPAMHLFPHLGDWHAAADEHRAWIETWIAKPEPPASFAQSSGWHFFFMKQQDGRELFTYADLPRMAEAAKAVGMPYMLLFGWHAPGHDNEYPYRYIPNEKWGGVEGLRAAIAEVRAKGVRLLPFYNGTLANPEVPEHKQFGHKWESKTRDGHSYHAGNWSHHGGDLPTRNRERMHVEICPCEEMQENFLKDVRRIAVDYGFGGIHLDQGADKMLLCYNEAHGHSTPDRACPDGFGRLIPETRAIVREADPEGVMIVECMNELAGQWADGAWSWSMIENPEPILYSLPWIFFSTELDAFEYAEANTCFVYKINMDLRINGGYELVTEYPAFADHLARLAALRRRTLDYYVHGAFRDREGIEVKSTGDALVKVYRNVKAGKAAIVAVERAGADAQISLDVRLDAGRKVRLESSLSEGADLTLEPQMALTLQPFEVKVLCLDKVGNSMA